MALKDGLKATKRKGVFYKEHPKRIYGSTKDRLYVLRFTIDGRTRAEAFGWASEGKTEIQAELKILEFRANFKEGSGPTSLADEREAAQRERREEEARQRHEITVARLIDEYVERHAKRKNRDWKENERALRKDLIPAWGDWLAKDVTRRDVNKLLEDIVAGVGRDRGPAPEQACNVLARARKMFNLAVSWGYCEYNPFLGVERPVPYKSRDRVLTKDEIKTLWHSLESGDLSMSDEMRRIFRLILLTAQRPGEVCGMHRDEIDGHWWTIPRERSKNGRAHRVYLTDTALALLGVSDGYIFPSSSDRGHIAVNALATSLRRNIKGASDGKNRKKTKPESEKVNRIGIEFFRPHDLRRTAVTCMAQIGVSWEVRERVVNHTLGRLEQTYNQYDYDKEKQAALELWERHLLKTVGKGSAAKVISMKKRGV